MNISKFCLGTVKLGMPNYGHSSTKNDNSSFTAIQVLKNVETLGIYRVDTSPRYGTSEEILGQYFTKCEILPFVSSKIDFLRTNESCTPEIMIENVTLSLKKLNINHLDICYLHQNDISIISDPYVHIGLNLLKEKKLIKYSGASVYTLEECAYAIESKMFDYIQVPINIFDISFYYSYIKSGFKHVRFTARSILLQGIIANRKNILNQIKYAEDILNCLEAIDVIASENNLTTTQLALAYVFSLVGVDHYIIGSTSLHNIKKNIDCQCIKLNQETIESITNLATKKKIWTNPRNW